jgi:hypothetical protein
MLKWEDTELGRESARVKKEYINKVINKEISIDDLLTYVQNENRHKALGQTQTYILLGALPGWSEELAFSKLSAEGIDPKKTLRRIATEYHSRTILQTLVDSQPEPTRTIIRRMDPYPHVGSIFEFYQNLDYRDIPPHIMKICTIIANKKPDDEATSNVRDESTTLTTGRPVAPQAAPATGTPATPMSAEDSDDLAAAGVGSAPHGEHFHSWNTSATDTSSDDAYSDGSIFADDGGDSIFED